MRASQLFINCLPSLAPFLERELEDLGYTPTRVERGGVALEGGWKEVYDLNLHLRTASRILWEIRSMEVSTPDELYAQSKKIPWHKLIPEDGYVSVQSYVKNDMIRDTRFPNLRLKDAIVDRMAEENGIRPDSGNEKDSTVVYLHWVGKEAHIYFDTSGETIAKHGYRKMPHKAPMIEALAASCLIQAGWGKDKGSFVNPMCGSGTLAIEAAMMVASIPPGYHRHNFGFMHILGYDETVWADIRKEVRTHKEVEVSIIATDWDEHAIRASENNAKAAGVNDMITFYRAPFEETIIVDGPGIVMLNPPYGERLGEEESLRETYSQIGDFFKKSCSGKTGYVFTGNPQLAKSIGLKPRRRTEFMSAKIDCRLLSFELYSGSKRQPIAPTTDAPDGDTHPR